MADESPRPEDLMHMSPREILAQGQIEHTRNHDIAVRWLQGARLRGAEVKASDPSFLGEAAALLAIRSELAGAPEQVAEHWLTFADVELGEPNIPRRQQAAAAIASLRIAALRLYKRNAQDIDVNRALRWSKTANIYLKTEHRTLRSWDRYATMLDKHRAMLELLDNKSIAAARFALRGIWRAVYASDEGQPLQDHKTFVAKQRRSNAQILKLASTPHKADAYTFVGPKRAELYNLLGRPVVFGYILEPHG